MEFIGTSRSGPITVVTLQRGKVNALNNALVLELSGCVAELERDDSVRAILLTGRGKFFSFEFDVPEFLSYSKEEFVRYLTAFTGLYTRLFECPKPVIAALNGHAIAGGCMIALGCDHRIMSRDGGKIALNEITFGSSVFAGSVEMLQSVVGHRNAETILYSRKLFDAEEALRLGLVDGLSSPEGLMKDAEQIALQFAELDPTAFRSIKGLVRRPIVERMKTREADSVRQFADIWYSESTREQLQRIQIRK
jgi:3,2-trans-enoyl-CoA isomerase